MKTIIGLLLLSTIVFAQVANTSIEMVEDSVLESDSLKAIYHEDFGPGKSISQVLFGALSEGDDGVWQRRLTDGKYQMSNATDGSSIRYSWFANLPGIDDDLAGQAVSVTITGDFSDGLSAAGLIFRFDPETKNYFAFTIENGNKYAFYVRDDNGVRRPISGSSEYIRSDYNVLTIVPNAEQMKLFINSHAVGALRSAEINGSAVGIFAAGIGKFLFDDFIVFEANADLGKQSAAAGLKTYENPSRGFTLDYPEDWVVLDEEEDKPVTFAKNEDSMIIVLPLNFPLSKDKTLVDQMLAIFEKSYSDLEIKSIADGEMLGRVPIKLIDLSFVNAGVKTDARWFIPLDNKDLGFMMMYASPSSKFLEEQAGFERSIASFRLMPKTE